MVNTWDKIKMKLRWNRRTARPRKSRRSISKSNQQPHSKRPTRSRRRSSNRSRSRSSTASPNRRRDSRQTSTSNIHSSPASNYSISSPKLRKYSSSRSGLFGCLSNAPPREYPDGPEPNRYSNTPIHLKPVSRSPSPRSRTVTAPYIVEEEADDIGGERRSPELLGAASPCEHVENSSKFIKDSFSPCIPSRSPSMERELRDQEGPPMTPTPVHRGMDGMDHYGAMTPGPQSGASVFDTPITPGADLTSFEDIYEGVHEEERERVERSVHHKMGMAKDEEGLQPKALYGDLESIDLSNLKYHYFNDSTQSDDDDMAINDNNTLNKDNRPNSIREVDDDLGDRLQEEEKRESTPRRTTDCNELNEIEMNGEHHREMYHYPSCDRLHQLDITEGVAAMSTIPIPIAVRKDDLYHDLEAIQDREFIEELKRNGIDHPEEIMQPVWDQQIENERGPQIMGILQQFCHDQEHITLDHQTTIDPPLQPYTDTTCNSPVAVAIDRVKQIYPELPALSALPALPTDEVVNADDTNAPQHGEGTPVHSVPRRHCEENEDSDIFNKTVQGIDAPTRHPVNQSSKGCVLRPSNKLSKSCSALPAIPTSIGLHTEAPSRVTSLRSMQLFVEEEEKKKEGVGVEVEEEKKQQNQNQNQHQHRGEKREQTKSKSKSRKSSKKKSSTNAASKRVRSRDHSKCKSPPPTTTLTVSSTKSKVSVSSMSTLKGEGKVKAMVRDIEAAAASSVQSKSSASKPPLYTASQSVTNPPPKSRTPSRRASRSRAGSAPVVDRVREAFSPQETSVFERRYEIGRKINEGGFGSVWRIRDTCSGYPTSKCVKIMDLGRDESSYSRKSKTAIREFSMTHRAFADDMEPVELYMDDIAGTDEPKAYLVMPYFKGKDLFEYIDDEDYPDKVNDDLILHIFYKIIEKLYDLHYIKKIVHGDLKPENVMILQNRESGEIEVEIIDYGIAKSLRNLSSDSKYLKSKGHFGTKGYVAPELMLESRYNRKIDVFSVGVVLYNMVTECCLFTKGHKYYKMTQNEYYKYLKRKFKPIRKKTAIINLLYSCLTYDPDERLDVKRLLNRYFHPQRRDRR